MLPKFLRTAAERISRNVVFASRLPHRFGGRTIYVSPANQLAILKPGPGKFSRELLSFVDRFVSSKDVVWDIGANMGVFSFAAAHLGARVVAFEPDPFNQRLLLRTFEANPDLHFTLVPAAVSDTAGAARLRIPVRGRSTCALDSANPVSDTGGTRGFITVDTVTLDSMLERHPAPSFVKCDAEGAELMVLRGGQRLLSDIRPILEIELSADGKAECEAMLKSLNYVLVEATARIARDSTPVTCELLAVPEEKFHLVEGR